MREGIKEEPSDSEQERSRRRIEGEVSPVVLREARRREERGREVGEEPGEEETEAPPGRWYWVEPPPEPSLPPRNLRPVEPPGPPPGWVGRTWPRDGPRSKGVKRRERNQDILLYGPDPLRKKAREEERRR